MTASEKKFLSAVQEQLIFLRGKKFATATKFGNAANLNERRNELYIADYKLTTIAKMIITLDVELSELITKDMLEKFAKDLEADEQEREASGK